MAPCRDRSCQRRPGGKHRGATPTPYAKFHSSRCQTNANRLLGQLLAPAELQDHGSQERSRGHQRPFQRDPRRAPPLPSPFLSISRANITISPTAWILQCVCYPWVQLHSFLPADSLCRAFSQASSSHPLFLVLLVPIRSSPPELERKPPRLGACALSTTGLRPPGDSLPAARRLQRPRQARKTRRSQVMQPLPSRDDLPS